MGWTQLSASVVFTWTVRYGALFHLQRKPSFKRPCTEKDLQGLRQKLCIYIHVANIQEVCQ